VRYCRLHLPTPAVPESSSWAQIPAISLAHVLLLLFLVGCAPREDEHQLEAPDDDDAQVTLGPPTDSSIERVPVPSAAERLTDSDAGLEGIQDVYRVPGSTFDHVDAWYYDYLPPGTGFRGWAWCETPQGHTFAQRTYYRERTEEILTVVITADDPPNIIISRERGIAC
jgi:hypothetical protein